METITLEQVRLLLPPNLRLEVVHPPQYMKNAHPAGFQWEAQLSLVDGSGEAKLFNTALGQSEIDAATSILQGLMLDWCSANAAWISAKVYLYTNLDSGREA